MESTSILVQAIGAVLLSISVAAICGLLLARHLDNKHKPRPPKDACCNTFKQSNRKGTP